jgi:alanine dehydrogenase
VIIGILKEIKAEENRVALTPGGVEVLVQNEHKVLFERDAGRASGFPDAAYSEMGAEIIEKPSDIFSNAEMIIGVREPQPQEYELIREDQIFLKFFHLAVSEELTHFLLKTGAIYVAYETIQKRDGSLPLLTPMSEIAGPMSIQEGAKYLEMAQGGHGILLGGVPGVDPGTVLILGGGVVGMNAAKMACGLGAKVYLLDIKLERLRYLSDVMPSNCFLLMSNPSTIRRLAKEADLIVGSVLIPGSKTPTLITRDMLKTMKKGTVMVDVAIDQGGCFETSKPTTHSDPIYVVDDVVHYCVGNMPGAVPKTSTVALTNASLPYVVEIANKGWEKVFEENSEIRCGANVVKGNVTHKGVADALGLEYVPVENLV